MRMKSFIKKVLIVVVILATVVDWPVETDAVNTKPLVKTGVSLLKSCSRETKTIEKNVNKATQATKEAFNGAMNRATVNGAVNKTATRTLKDSTFQRMAIRGSSNVLNHATHNNTQTISSLRVVPCKQCKGHGTVQGNDGYVYSCSRCKGTGKIFIK